MINFLAKLLTCFIPIRKIRRLVRHKIITLFYGYGVYRKAKHVGRGFVCGSSSCATRNTIIGDYVRFSGVHCFGHGIINIGNHCVFGYDVSILTDNHNYDKGTLLPYSDEYIISKNVNIEQCVWCGSKVIILPGTTIGEGAVIQAGSVVHGVIPPCAVVGGNPAKIFKYRDIEHYNELKEKDKFLKISD